MITEHHFPTIIYIKDLPNALQLNQYLEQKIIQWSQQDKGVSKTNAGGWHSTTDMNRKEVKLPPELWREVQYEPVAGRCIMFPSWLWHEVKPNQSNDIRISVSFNFLQR